MDRNLVACAAPEYLMCPPQYFGVDYVINPWMKGNRGNVNRKVSAQQWARLACILRDELGAKLRLMAPAPDSPDMVFTANAGLVRAKKCVLARFRHKERSAEEPFYRRWFAAHGFEIWDLPPGLAFEGAGDALFDEAESRLLWAASGSRTDRDSHTFLAEAFGVEVISLMLSDPRFYHLDTCFCPLPGGLLLWRPEAFDDASRRVVTDTIDKAKRYAVSEEAADAFICNAVAWGSTVVANRAPEASIGGLRAWLAEHGLTLRTTPLWEFMKAGGSAKCLTVRLE